jgi:hypothetical protein
VCKALQTCTKANQSAQAPHAVAVATLCPLGTIQCCQQLLSAVLAKIQYNKSCKTNHCSAIHTAILSQQPQPFGRLRSLKSAQAQHTYCGPHRLSTTGCLTMHLCTYAATPAPAPADQELHTQYAYQRSVTFLIAPGQAKLWQPCVCPGTCED